MTKGKPTPKEVRDDLWEAVEVQGLPVAVAAKDLGLSDSTAFGILRDMREGKPGRPVRPTTVELEMDVLAGLSQGATQAEVARDLGISQARVSKIKRKYERAAAREEEREQMEMTIAGNKATGTLTSTGMGSYTGTCALSGGKTKKRVFKAKDGLEAKAQWEEWCERLRGKEELPDWVTGEREPEPQPEVEVPQEVDAEVEEETAEVPPTQPDGPIYVLALGTPMLKCYFRDMEEALRDEAVLNSGLEFAGVDVRFQVVEVGPCKETV